MLQIPSPPQTANGEEKARKEERTERSEGRAVSRKCETEIVVLRGKMLDSEQVVLPET